MGSVVLGGINTEAEISTPYLNRIIAILLDSQENEIVDIEFIYQNIKALGVNVSMCAVEDVFEKMLEKGILTKTAEKYRIRYQRDYSYYQLRYKL